MEKPILIRTEELKKLNETVSTCERVAQTVGTNGWIEIIAPLIDKMIMDITGGKTIDGRWYSGMLDKARKDERREYYIGYKQALIDLHRRIYAYVDAIPRLKEQREDIIKHDDDKTTVPMLGDTRYGRDFSA